MEEKSNKNSKDRLKPQTQATAAPGKKNDSKHLLSDMGSGQKTTPGGSGDRQTEQTPKGSRASSAKPAPMTMPQPNAENAIMVDPPSVDSVEILVPPGKPNYTIMLYLSLVIMFTCIWNLWPNVAWRMNKITEERKYESPDLKSANSKQQIDLPSLIPKLQGHVLMCSYNPETVKPLALKRAFQLTQLPLQYCSHIIYDSLVFQNEDNPYRIPCTHNEYHNSPIFGIGAYIALARHKAFSKQPRFLMGWMGKYQDKKIAETFLSRQPDRNYVQTQLVPPLKTEFQMNGLVIFYDKPSTKMRFSDYADAIYEGWTKVPSGKDRNNEKIEMLTYVVQIDTKIYYDEYKSKSIRFAFSQAYSYPNVPVALCLAEQGTQTGFRGFRMNRLHEDHKNSMEQRHLAAISVASLRYHGPLTFKQKVNQVGVRKIKYSEYCRKSTSIIDSYGLLTDVGSACDYFRTDKDKRYGDAKGAELYTAMNATHTFDLYKKWGKFPGIFLTDILYDDWSGQCENNTKYAIISKIADILADIEKAP